MKSERVMRSGFSAELIRDVSKAAEEHERLMLLGDSRALARATFVKQLIVRYTESLLGENEGCLRMYRPA